MKKLSIHAFFHVPFEGLGCIEQWINIKGHSLSSTHFYSKYELPNLNSIDWLIVMGGPMGIYDEEQYPWLSEEKRYIKEAIEKGKTVIGICLGSQLIANVLGANVFPNKQKEIGWYDINVTENTKKIGAFKDFENRFPVFHWHGDTFDLPEKSIHLFYSKVCVNQGFIYNDKVLGLQFHFEVTENSLLEMLENGALELIEDETIQSAKQIIEQKNLIKSNNEKIFQLLNYLDCEK